jgi:hypothetical protein
LIGFFFKLDSYIHKIVDGSDTCFAFYTGSPIDTSSITSRLPMSADLGARPFATGGIVTAPMMGLVGEAGPEAIIPLDRMGKMGGNSYNITVQAGVGDPQVIGQQIVAYIKRYEKASGPVFAGA